MSSVGGLGGSGLDVNTIVAQLVAAERAPADGRIDRADRRLQAEISAIGTLRGAFSGLRTAVSALASNDSAQARKATVPEGSGFAVSAGAGAAVGRYQVEVMALATAHKLSSTAYTKPESAVGTGRLTINAGTTKLEVDIDAEHNSLGAIRDAINAKAAGSGVVASIVQADDGAHLVLSALKTGKANAITVSASGGDGGLAGLAYPGGMNQVIAADDARVIVDGFERHSAENSISDLVPGVTLNLTKAEPGTKREVVVSNDPSAQRTAIKNFVNAYNASIAAINTTTSYNSSTKVAAALNGDAMVRGASSELRGQLSGSVTDLKALGVTIAKDGTLKFEEGGFDAAIAKDPLPAARLFGANGSLTGGLKASLDGILNDDGMLDSRSDALSQRTRSIEKQRTDLDHRMEQVEKRYRAQFIALDTMVSKMQSTSSYLAQQLAAL
ncbi:flagellar filament capping protein FliD [Lysobacter niastensis]|uniref:Flagellar hook-associated protein 2 n=1 Tax=Lysobacter niastensis TaxID=380629 RepID=A0ABS0B9L9_9GAMM|nr:flagellar filament capping protein FliD [Lysobacter niastensis]MBF6025598.1 flagellar filament capping protein FliD [Lysobacter niastensis]